MTTLTGGEVLLRCLAQEGVKRIIGITDAGYHAMQHHCREYGLRFVAPRHEAAGAHIAQGIYKSSGEVSAVASGGGPGTANVLAGVICAQAEGAPMIVITAQRRKEVVYPTKIGVYQGADQLDWFRPHTKWNAVVHDWERIPEIVSRAFREALCGRPGPVQIDVPQDVMDQKGDASKLRLLAPHQYRALRRVEPSAGEVAEIAGLLADAENPLLMAGQGVLDSEGWSEFQALVEFLDVPAVTTIAGRSVLSDSHPNKLGGGTPGAVQARRESDLVVVFGSCLGELDLPFDKYWGGPEQKIVQVDIDSRSLGLHRPLHLGVVGDARATCRLLLERLRADGVKPRDHARVAGLVEINEKATLEIGELVSQAFADDRIHPVQSVRAVNEVFPADSIAVVDGGNTSLFAGAFARVTRPRSVLGLFEFGHLGTGIPMAIGAKLANPDREVFCITGDGAAGFNFMEMETAVREGVNITVVVHAEGSWCMEEIFHVMEQADPETYRSVYMAPTRWDQIGTAVGCHAEFVERPAQLVPALQRALAEERPSVVCVRTSRESNLVPPGAESFAEVYTGVQE
jgi:acetolactate synthase-1/2/3 large subunit